MARKKVERNISYDDVRKKYYVNLDFGIDPETGKQIKKSKTSTKVMQPSHVARCGAQRILYRCFQNCTNCGKYCRI